MWVSAHSLHDMDIRITSAVIEIVTADLPRSLSFYRLLGLVIPDFDGPHVEVEMPGGNRLAFDTEDVIAGMHPGWAPPPSAGRVALAFGLGSAAEVDGLFDRLTDAGHPGVLDPFDAPWGQRYASVIDPDGTTIDLFAALSS
jgi:catechol 2,3-dioxygenase-like lactoylglutathione lyase family enzyme